MWYHLSIENTIFCEIIVYGYVYTKPVNTSPFSNINWVSYLWNCHIQMFQDLFMVLIVKLSLWFSVYASVSYKSRGSSSKHVCRLLWLSLNKQLSVTQFVALLYSFENINGSSLNICSEKLHDIKHLIILGIFEALNYSQYIMNRWTKGIIMGSII